MGGSQTTGQMIDGEKRLLEQIPRTGCRNVGRPHMRWTGVVKVAENWVQKASSEKDGRDLHTALGDKLVEKDERNS